MGLLNRKKPRDTSALYNVLRTGTLDQLDAVYTSTNVHYDGFSEQTLLELVLGNKNLRGRVEIAHRLLDDGADVRAGKPLHVLVDQNEHDFETEAILLKRMLDAGADVNQISPKAGTPLETAAAKFKFSDRDLTPFYDVLLARPDIDFLTESLNGRTVIARLRKWYAKRAGLVERVERTMTERGVPLPEPEK